MVHRLFQAAVASALAVALVGCGGGTLNSLLNGTPQIVSVSPNPIAPGATLTITGTNLNGVYTSVYITGPSSVQVNASSANTTSATVVIPNTLPAGSYSVGVVVNEGPSGNISESNLVALTVD